MPTFTKYLLELANLIISDGIQNICFPQKSVRKYSPGVGWVFA